MVGPRSVIQDSLDIHLDKINSLLQHMQYQLDKNQQTDKKVNDLETNGREARRTMKENQAKVNEELERRIRKLEITANMFQETMEQEQENIKHNKQEIERTQSALGNLKSDFNLFRIDTTNKINQNKEELQD